MTFGIYKAIPLDEDQTADQDLFLIVTISTGENDVYGSVFCSVFLNPDDVSGDPSISASASAFVQFNREADARISAGSFCLPIPKGALFHVFTHLNGTPAVTAHTLAAKSLSENPSGPASDPGAGEM